MYINGIIISSRKEGGGIMYIVYCLIVMFLVTYIPRVLPLCLIKKEIKSKFINSFLYYTPYAVLAALTFPYIIYASFNIYIGIICTGVAIILSLFKKFKMIYVLVIVLVLAYILQFIIK